MEQPTEVVPQVDLTEPLPETGLEPTEVIAPTGLEPTEVIAGGVVAAEATGEITREHRRRVSHRRYVIRRIGVAVVTLAIIGGAVWLLAPCSATTTTAPTAPTRRRRPPAKLPRSHRQRGRRRPPRGDGDDGGCRRREHRSARGHRAGDDPTARGAGNHRADRLGAGVDGRDGRHGDAVEPAGHRGLRPQLGADVHDRPDAAPGQRRTASAVPARAPQRGHRPAARRFRKTASTASRRRRRCACSRRPTSSRPTESSARRRAERSASGRSDAGAMPMYPELNEEHEALRARRPRVRRRRDRAARRGAGTATTRSPSTPCCKMGELGLFGIPFPEPVGGGRRPHRAVRRDRGDRPRSTSRWRSRSRPESASAPTRSTSSGRPSSRSGGCPTCAPAARSAGSASPSPTPAATPAARAPGPRSTSRRGSG